MKEKNWIVFPTRDAYEAWNREAVVQYNSRELEPPITILAYPQPAAMGPEIAVCLGPMADEWRGHFEVFAWEDLDKAKWPNSTPPRT